MRGILVVGAMALVAVVTVDARDLRRKNTSTQQAAATTGTGLLMGVVVDSLTDRPVAGSLVTLAQDSPRADADAGGRAVGLLVPPAPGGPRVLTDDQGHFVFSDLPKGTYTIVASMAGYSDGAYGRRRSAGSLQVLPLAEGERVGDLRIPIWKDGAVIGTVTDEAGEPLVGVPVQILIRAVVAGTRRLSPGRVVRTDDRGAYRIGSLPPGEYVVVVPSTQSTAPESVGDLYLKASQAARPGGQSDLVDDSSFGRTLSVLRSGFKVDTFRFQSSSNVSGSGVAPGPSGDGRIFVYPTEYYPAAATAAEATVITLRPGEERDGVDVPLKLAPTSRVSGMVTGPDGGPLTVRLALASAGGDVSTDTDLATATTASDAAGRFTFLGVPLGSYLLRVLAVAPAAANGPTLPMTPAGLTLWATQPIAVGASDVGDVVVAARQGFRIVGHVEFDDAAKQPPPDEAAHITATFEPADGRELPLPQLVSTQFDADGRFQSSQLPPGRYYLRVDHAPAGWSLKRATVDGQDISAVPLHLEHDINGLVVTLTDHASELNGQVQSASGAKDETATVLIFPAQSAAWMDTGATPSRFRQIRTDKDGGYRALGLPTGEYLVVAVAEESATDWQDPKTLQTLARVATSVTLRDGETRSLGLKTVVVLR